MEKITSICMMRDLVVALQGLEDQLLSLHGVGLNEAMALCAIAGECVPSTEIAQRIGQRAPNTSKILSTLVRKGLATGESTRSDKRKSLYRITPAGLMLLGRLKASPLDIPELLRPIYLSQLEETGQHKGTRD